MRFWMPALSRIFASSRGANSTGGCPGNCRTKPPRVPCEVMNRISTSSALSMTSPTARIAAAILSRLASGMRLHRVGTIDQPHDAIVDRQHLGQRCQRAVELLDEHVLVGPAGDADGVEIGRRPCVAAQAGRPPISAARAARRPAASAGAASPFPWTCLCLCPWPGWLRNSSRVAQRCNPRAASSANEGAINNATADAGDAAASHPCVRARSRHAAIILTRFVPVIGTRNNW